MLGTTVPDCLILQLPSWLLRVYCLQLPYQALCCHNDSILLEYCLRQYGSVLHNVLRVQQYLFDWQYRLYQNLGLLTFFLLSQALYPELSLIFIKGRTISFPSTLRQAKSALVDELLIDFLIIQSLEVTVYYLVFNSLPNGLAYI